MLFVFTFFINFLAATASLPTRRGIAGDSTFLKTRCSAHSSLRRLQPKYIPNREFLSRRLPSHFGRIHTGQRKDSIREAIVPNAHTFEAAESTMLTIQEREGYRVEDYLEQVERIVHMTFPDKNRRTKIDPNTWQVRLLTQDFVGVQFRPVTQLKVFCDQKGLHITVSELDLDMPPQFQVDSPILKVEGILKPATRLPRNKVILRGSVKMTLTTDLPAPFMAIPGVQNVAEAVMKRIITQLKQSLEAGLANDYEQWTQRQQQQQVAAPAASS